MFRRLNSSPFPKRFKDASADFVDDSNPVLGFIMSHYELTNNDDDKINSTALYNHFISSCRDSKVSTKRFKDDILGISGISTKRHRTSGILFLGLKLREVVDDDEDE